MKNRPELFELISGRQFHSFNAKLKSLVFDDDEYTKMVLNRIEHCDNDSLTYHENGFTLLHLAVQEYEYDFVIALLKKGAAVNARTQHGKTPLHTAISRYKEEKSNLIIQALLQHGADYSIQFGGMSATEFATLKGIDDIWAKMISAL